MNRVLLVFFIALNLVQTKALGWGAYGHEQINNAAIELLRDSSLGSCLANNRDLMVRLAVTPDLDWKWGGQDSSTYNVYMLLEEFPKLLAQPNPDKKEMIYFASKIKKILDHEAKAKKKKTLSPELVKALGDLPRDPKVMTDLLTQLRDQEAAAGKLGPLSYEVLQQKRKVDLDEHSMHFFEADSYTGANGIADLPSDGNFDGVDLVQYEKKLKDNESYVMSLDPCKTGAPSRQVTQHGTAPWRAYSLYKMGVAALGDAVKNRNPEKFNQALRLLGTMGHYIGDMGQPFHGTLSFDGKLSDAATMGIHSTYEEKILERYAKQQVRAKQDKYSKIWAPFDATQETVLKYSLSALGSRTPALISDDLVVKNILHLVSTGYPLIPSLFDAFKAARLADKKYVQMDLPLVDCNNRKRVKTTAVHAVTVENFMNAKIALPGLASKVTVLESAEKRMGEAAALLAQLWASAVASAKISDRDLKSFCPNIPWDNNERALVITDYPPITHHKSLSDFDKNPSRVETDSEPVPTEVTTESSDDPEQLDLFDSSEDDEAPRDPSSIKKPAAVKVVKPASKN